MAVDSNRSGDDRVCFEAAFDYGLDVIGVVHVALTSDSLKDSPS